MVASRSEMIINDLRLELAVPTGCSISILVYRRGNADVTHFSVYIYIYTVYIYIYVYIYNCNMCIDTY